MKIKTLLPVEQLLDHIRTISGIGDVSVDQIGEYFESREIKKKGYLQEPNNRAAYNFFMISGCAQMFYVTEKGVNQTVQFAIENWWINDSISFQKEQPSEFGIQAIEQCQVLVISKSNYDKLLNEFPQLERYFRLVYQIAYGAAMYRLKYQYEYSKEQHYFNFIQHHPEFAQRVPQYLIASYLGLTPEYVSEIRAKSVS